MVTIVAALLAFVALQLKPIQTKNIEIEKMQNILASVGIQSEKGNIESDFEKYITEKYVINQQGEKIEGVAAFDVDLKKELTKIESINTQKGLLVEKRVSPFKKMMGGAKEVDKSSIEQNVKTLTDNRQLPVYVCNHPNGNTYYIFPLQGKGLWGPIWGYISVEDDMNTVYGAVYDHKGETPGLGAEIKTDWFGNSFKGKKLFSDDNTFQSIAVIKSGSAPKSNYNVDAISGGTITSKGVEKMLLNNLSGYVTFMENKRK